MYVTFVYLRNFFTYSFNKIFSKLSSDKRFLRSAYIFYPVLKRYFTGAVAGSDILHLRKVCFTSGKFFVRERNFCNFDSRYGNASMLLLITGYVY